MNRKNATIAIIAGLMLLVGGVVFLNDYSETEQEPYASIRPGMEDWILASSLGFSYRYPESLDTAYIAEATWPPVVERVVNEYSCTTGAAAVDGRATYTNESVINGRTYCGSVSSEGAAGSTYVSYEYSTDLGDMVVRVYFALRYPQCANYDLQEYRACAEEEESFRPNELADSIFSTIERETP